MINYGESDTSASIGREIADALKDYLDVRSQRENELNHHVEMKRIGAQIPDHSYDCLEELTAEERQSFGEVRGHFG